MAGADKSCLTQADVHCPSCRWSTSQSAAAWCAQVVQTSQQGAWKYDAAKRQNPDRRNRKWIPLVLAAQLAFKFLVIDRVLEEDGVRGDQWGPYDDKIVRIERRKRAQVSGQYRSRCNHEHIKAPGIPKQLLFHFLQHTGKASHGIYSRCSSMA